MKKNYKKSALIVIHILLALILIFFTALAMSDYRKNILLGYFISLSIFILYFFLLKKSASLFTEERVGFAYFLAIGGFLGLMFIQLINCINSIHFLGH